MTTPKSTVVKAVSEFTVLEDKCLPRCWRVEFIDHASEEECYVALFSGTNAEGRAREYAVCKTSQ